MELVIVDCTPNDPNEPKDASEIMVPFLALSESDMIGLCNEINTLVGNKSIAHCKLRKNTKYLEKLRTSIDADFSDGKPEIRALS